MARRRRRRHAQVEQEKAPGTTAATWSMGGSGGWYPIVHEPFTGAWQRNQEQRVETVAAFHAVWSCATLIASDVSKVRIRLVQQEDSGIWSEVNATNPFSAVLRKPNRYQNRIEFFEQWMISKLLHGNAYVLKERDQRGIVTDLYVLDPCRTKALVAPDGSVMYQLSKDNLSGVAEDNIVIPASEIIHDRNSPIYHPLCGVSPLLACGLAAMQGLNIQENSAQFFANGARPGGVLTAPGKISDDTARRMKADWEARFTGQNVGRVAVLGDGLKYEAMTVSASDAQLIEQLKMSAEIVCGAFHVPTHKINVGQMPNYNNIEALDQAYYSQCLQAHFEKIELCLDEGLGLVNVQGRTYGTEFDLDDLLRMDTQTKVKAGADAVNAGIMAPNEARKKFDLPPVQGGETPYLQQQYWPLRQLSERAMPSEAPAAAASSDAPPPAQRSLGEDLDAEAMYQLVVMESKAFVRLQAE